MWIKRIASINQRASFFLCRARAQSRKQQARQSRTRRSKNFRQRPPRTSSVQKNNFRNAAGNGDHLLPVAIIERRSHAPRQSEFHLRAQCGKVGGHGRVNCQRPKASSRYSLFVRLEEFSTTPPRLSIARLLSPLAGPVSHFDTLPANTCCIFRPDEGFYWRHPLPLISGRQPKLIAKPPRAAFNAATGSRDRPKGDKWKLVQACVSAPLKFLLRCNPPSRSSATTASITSPAD